MQTNNSSVSTRVAGLVARYYLQKPDQADLLRIKFPDGRSMGWGALNEAAFRAGASRSARLTTLNIEITNRCNLNCVYCPVNSGLSRARTDLPFERFVEILDRAPTITDLLPFQWGEALLHPRIFDMLRLASGRGLRTYLTTNGTLLDQRRRREILDAGLERLTISVDGNDETHLRTRGVDLAPIRERVVRLRRERDASSSRMSIDVSMVVDEHTTASIEEYRREWSGVADRVQTIPRLIKGTRTKPCRELWRGLLVVLADGRVTACCGDSEGALDLGSIFESDAAKIFNGKRMRALRRLHTEGRLPPVCARCDEYQHAEVSPRFR
ncbi:MAG: radical SAM/SPASM domain-containing protein [Planctomycetota bacterium]